MGTVKAILVGVSDYSAISQPNLPFCKNDIAIMRQTLISNLDMEPADIISLGWNGKVTRAEFLNRLLLLQSCIQKTDTLLFYFSGHGGIFADNSHNLAFSDGFLTTQKLIDAINETGTKNKLIILDACFSGKYTIKPGKKMNTDDWLEPFVNTGCAVISSSSKNQVSRLYPGENISIFTYFFCLALRGCSSSKKEGISFEQIYEVILMFLDRWNKEHPNMAQNPAYRSNIGGTIMFRTKDPRTYHVNTFVSDHADYSICSVEPVHFANVKRLRVTAILKHPVTPEELSAINWDIINEVSYADVYQSEIAERRFKGRPANIVFCFFGYDAEDITNSTYAYRTTWTDRTQDRKHWYAPSKDSVDIGDIHIVTNEGYSSIKEFEKAHTGDRKHIIHEEKEIVSKIVVLAEQVIGEYREYRNTEISEPELIARLQPILPQIEELFFRELDLDIPPVDIHDWAYACSALISTVHDFVYYYKEQYLDKRTVENRRQCMDITINRYHEDLRKLQEAENELK